MTYLLLLFNTTLEVRKITNIQTIREEKNYYLFTENMIWYTENPKNSAQNLWELTSITRLKYKDQKKSGVPT